MSCTRSSHTTRLRLPTPTRIFASGSGSQPHRNLRLHLCFSSPTMMCPPLHCPHPPRSPRPRHPPTTFGRSSSFTREHSVSNGNSSSARSPPPSSSPSPTRALVAKPKTGTKWKAPAVDGVTGRRVYGGPGRRVVPTPGHSVSRSEGVKRRERGKAREKAGLCGTARVRGVVCMSDVYPSMSAADAYTNASAIATSPNASVADAPLNASAAHEHPNIPVIDAYPNSSGADAYPATPAALQGIAAALYAGHGDAMGCAVASDYTILCPGVGDGDDKDGGRGAGRVLS